MPTWTTTTVGGSWNSPGTTTFDCNVARRQSIALAYQNFINLPVLNFFTGLRNALMDSWDDCEIDCTDPVCTTLAGQQSGNRILICPNVFALGQDRVNAVVLHELVHHAGGRELDSEAIEWACFGGGNGATAPTPGDFTDFANDPIWDGNANERHGTWAIVNRTTGQVWGKDISGGGWGGPTIFRGTLVFTSAGFIF